MHQILSCKKQQKQKEDREMEMDTQRDMERQTGSLETERSVLSEILSLCSLRVT